MKITSSRPLMYREQMYQEMVQWTRFCLRDEFQHAHSLSLDVLFFAITTRKTTTMNKRAETASVKILQGVHPCKLLSDPCVPCQQIQFLASCEYIM